MLIQTANRREIEKQSNVGFEPKTALISITDSDKESVTLYNTPTYLLHLSFDDSDEIVFALGLFKRWAKSNSHLSYAEYREQYIADLSSEERQVIENSNKMFSVEQAKEIAKFIHQISSDAEVIICQCEAGMRRSVSVAKALCDTMGITDENIERKFSNNHNSFVYQRLIENLMYN